MINQEKNLCCETKPRKTEGVVSGILYGLLPHSFCIAFAILAILGATTATAILKKILLVPNLSTYLIIISLLLATITSTFYLKQISHLNLVGLKKKWRYLTTLFTLTIIVNFLIFYWVMPVLANTGSLIEPTAKIAPKDLAQLTLNVQIPCSGHAPLIDEEIRKALPIESIKFELPSNFIIKYDPTKISAKDITSLEIFKTYQATIIK